MADYVSRSSWYFLGIGCLDVFFVDYLARLSCPLGPTGIKATSPTSKQVILSKRFFCRPISFSVIRLAKFTVVKKESFEWR